MSDSSFFEHDVVEVLSSTPPSTPEVSDTVPFDNTETSLPSDDFEDIDHLMKLEAINRFTSELAESGLEVGEKIQKYRELKRVYIELYDKYVQLIKLSERFVLMNQLKSLNDLEKLTESKQSINTIVKSICRNNVQCPIDQDNLEQFKANVRSYKTSPNLQNEKLEIHANEKLTKMLQNSLQMLPARMESIILQSINQTARELQPEED